MVATVTLVVWVANAFVGLTLLRRWPQPPTKAYVHLAAVLVGLVGWTVYVVTHEPGWLGWLVLAWLMLVPYPLGDMLMLAGWRSRTRPARGTGARAYLAAAGGLLRSGSPLRIAHALLAPTILVLIVLALLG